MHSMRSSWSLDPEICYLNHGSFGPTPLPVQQAQQAWQSRLNANPMKLLVREREQLQDQMLSRLGEFVGCGGKDLIPVENATVAMNIVAASVPLEPGDEIVITDHEYGAVQRIWRERAQQCSANIRVAKISLPVTNSESIVESVMAAVSTQTKIIVLSHVTSPTALVLPVKEICRRAREIKIPVCIDGPHAIAMQPLKIDQLNCDYYCASCHKWLSAPTGTGFLYVHPRNQSHIQQAITSWGGTMYGRPSSWQEEFLWVGTSDPARFLCIPAAIDFLEEFGRDRFRTDTHHLALMAYDRFHELFQSTPIVPRDQEFFGSMITIPLPEHVQVPEEWTGLPHPLQENLAQQYGIEVPLHRYNHRMHIRISCHLYNSLADLERLEAALVQIWKS